MAKKTQWYPANFKPVRVGIYETDAEKGAFQFWDGQCWGAFSTSSEMAFAYGPWKSSHQNAKWRGLAAPK